MLGIGGTELVIILLFGFLLFGPDRLPSMGRTIGRALRQFRQAQDQMNKMVKTEIYDPLNEATKEPQTQSSDITAIPLADGRVLARTTADTPTATKTGWFTTVFQES